jgi:hypothetical protein
MSNHRIPGAHRIHPICSIQFFVRTHAWFAAAAFFAVLLSSGSALAQDSPRAQLFAGYSFLSFNSQPFGFADRTSLNGLTIAPSFNLTHEFGITAQLSGQYGSQLSVRNATVGPQVIFTRGNMLFFGHLLIGKGRTFVKVGNGAGDSARALELGGGIDLGLSTHFSVRAVQADFVHNSFFNGSQSSFRISTGLVYHLGGIKKGRRPSLTD